MMTLMHLRGTRRFAEAVFRSVAYPERYSIAVFVVAALAFFGRLDAPLLEPEEARYAEIPRQMLAASEWVVPTLHGQPYLDKPPLAYWLTMLCYRAFGVGTPQARLAPAACGFLTVVVVAWWGRRTAGPRAGLLAATALAVAPLFAYRARILGMDSPLALFTSLALAAGHARRWGVCGLALGLGLLTKGPVAVVLVMPPLAVMVRRPLGLAVACLIAGGVAGPWYAVMASRAPAFGESFVWTHHVERYLRPFDHAGPPWLYVGPLLLGMLPASLALVRVGRDRRAWLGLLAAGWAFLFFSLSGCKRPAYLLPALPPLAVALGVLVAPLQTRWVPRLAAVAVAVQLAASLVAWPVYAARFSLVAAVPTDAAVACYPKRFDAATFALRRDVPACDSPAALCGYDAALVKADRVAELPAGWVVERKVAGVAVVRATPATRR